MKLTIGGRTDTETSDVAVKPTGRAPGSETAVTTATRAAWSRKTERNVASSPAPAGGSGGGSGTTRSDTRAKGTSTCGTAT